MAAPAAPISIPSIFNTLSSAPRTREHHAATRILAGIDPKRFLSNLQMAAMHHSPQAISALKADMYELADIFHKLSKAGHDVSAAQRDFKMLELYVSQLSSSQKQRSLPRAPVYPSTPVSKEKQSYSQSQSYHSHRSDHRSSSLPTSLSSSHEQPQSRSGSIASDKTPRHHHHPLPLPSRTTSQAPSTQPKGFAPGSTASSSSSRSSSRASIVAPTPSRLSKSRRHSAPATIPAKKVHWASHATVYTFTTETPVPPPPSMRPSCVPRVSSH